MFKTSINLNKQVGSIEVGRNIELNRSGKLIANNGSITLESKLGNILIIKGSSNIVLSEDNLELNGDIEFSKGEITQSTALANDVYLSKSSGKIITVSSTLFPKSTEFFTLFNSYIKANSIVICGISGYSGTDGIPFCYIDDIVEGSCDIMVSNLHRRLELNGIMKISFIIF